ncbi:hypothetical protein ABT230_004235 [Providencia rettgeri]
MTDKKYKCHDCGEETKIIAGTSIEGAHGFIVQCPHCGYEAGLFRTIKDAEFIINSNLSQGCNKGNEYERQNKV